MVQVPVASSQVNWLSFDEDNDIYHQTSSALHTHTCMGWGGPTTSALSASSYVNRSLSRQYPVQYIATGDMHCFSRSFGESSQGTGDPGTSVMMDSEGWCRAESAGIPESFEPESTPSIEVRAQWKTCLFRRGTGPTRAEISARLLE